MAQKVLTVGGGACPAKASSARTVHGICSPAARLNATSTTTLNATSTATLNTTSAAMLNTTSVTSPEPARLVAGATVVGS